MRTPWLAALLFLSPCVLAQSPGTSPVTVSPVFDAATIKPVEWQPKGGRFLKMETDNRFLAKDYTLKLLIAAAYDLNPKAIIGGPKWVDSDHFDIQAITPGDTRPDFDTQMKMLRALLTERFGLKFHRQEKQTSIFEITVAKDGPKLKATAVPNDPTKVISVVYPGKIVMPARNASISDLARVMQRAILDRPVVDRTGLSGKYDFDLEWAPDGSQFGGEIPAAPEDSDSLPLLQAMQEQLGLQIRATRGPVQAFLIDEAEPPTVN